LHPSREKGDTPKETAVAVDLTEEEMEMVLLALKERIGRLRADAGMAAEETNLVARLEVVQREHRGAPGPGRCRRAQTSRRGSGRCR
jgi:hypothetical protein